MRHDDLLHALANLHELRRTGLRVRLQLAPLGPGVRLVVVIDVAQQQAVLGAVHDEPQIEVHPHRPKVLVLGLVQLVKAKARLIGIELQIEGRGLHGLLLVAAQAREAVGEGVRDAELHHFTLKTFITSSPRWLMTLTAIRPDLGFSKAREVSLCRVSHASRSISALSVVLSALYGSLAPRKYACRTKKLSSLQS